MFLANNDRPIIHLILTTEGSGSIEPIVSPLSIDFFLLTLEDLDRLGSYVFFRTVLEKGWAISNSFCLRACLWGLMSVFLYLNYIQPSSICSSLNPLFLFSKQGLEATLVHSLSSGSTMPIQP